MMLVASVGGRMLQNLCVPFWSQRDLTVVYPRMHTIALGLQSKLGSHTAKGVRSALLAKFGRTRHGNKIDSKSIGAKKLGSGQQVSDGYSLVDTTAVLQGVGRS